MTNAPIRTPYRRLRQLLAASTLAVAALVAIPAADVHADADLQFQLTADCGQSTVDYHFTITNNGPDTVSLQVQVGSNNGWNLVNVTNLGVGSHTIDRTVNLNTIVQFAVYLNDVEIHDTNQRTSIAGQCNIPVWPLGEGIDVAGLTAQCGEGVTWTVGVAAPSAPELEVTWSIDLGVPLYALLSWQAGVGSHSNSSGYGAIVQAWVRDILGRVVFDSGEMVAQTQEACYRPAFHQIDASLSLECVAGQPHVVVSVVNAGDFSEVVTIEVDADDQSLHDNGFDTLGVGQAFNESFPVSAGATVKAIVKEYSIMSPEVHAELEETTAPACPVEGGPQEPPAGPGPGSGPGTPNPGIPVTGTNLTLSLLAGGLLLAGIGLRRVAQVR